MSQQITSLQGLSLENYHAQHITIEMLKDIDLQKFPPKKMHYLVNALLNNTKPPSEKSMIRSERRNELKSGAEKADVVIGRQRRPLNRAVRMPRPKRPFLLPNKFGPRPRPRTENDGRRRGGYRGYRGGASRRMPPNINYGANLMQLGQLPSSLPMGGIPLNMVPPPPFFPIPHLYQGPPLIGSVPPHLATLPNPLQPVPNIQSLFMNQPTSNISLTLNSINPVGINNSSIVEIKPQQKNPNDENYEKLLNEGKLPFQIVKKYKAKILPKQKSSAFKTGAPQLIALKAYKTQTIDQIEKYRKQQKSDKLPVMSEKLMADIPVYFQKKKANQKRRRQEKHELIKKNRKALYLIFGNTIYRSGWPISRKEIKTALGITDDQPIEAESVAQFLEMAQEEEKPLEQLMKDISIESQGKGKIQTQMEEEKSEQIQEKRE